MSLNLSIQSKPAMNTRTTVAEAPVVQEQAAVRPGFHGGCVNHPDHEDYQWMLATRDRVIPGSQSTPKAGATLANTPAAIHEKLGGCTNTPDKEDREWALAMNAIRAAR